jgi:cytochrome c oxidase subunit IV
MEPEQVSHQTRNRTYLLAWLGLVILTGMTVSLAGRGLGRLGILSVLLIAGTKSALILTYFMHLRSEKMLVFKVIIPLVLAVFLVFIILTFSDVAFRGGLK